MSGLSPGMWGNPQGEGKRGVFDNPMTGLFLKILKAELILREQYQTQEGDETALLCLY